MKLKGWLIYDFNTLMQVSIHTIRYDQMNLILTRNPSALREKLII